MKESETPESPEPLKYRIRGRMVEFNRPVPELSRAQIDEIHTALSLHHNQRPGWQAFEDWREL